MTSLRFTERVQLAMIILLLVAIVGIGQPWSFQVYEYAIAAAVCTGLAQVAIGNVPPSATISRFIRLLAIFLLVIVAIFALSIWLAPILVDLGK